MSEWAMANSASAPSESFGCCWANFSSPARAAWVGFFKYSRASGSTPAGCADAEAAAFLVVEDGLHVFQHALGLGFDVAGDEISGGGIQRDLPGAKEKIAGAYGVVIGADGGSRFGGFDDLFRWHVVGCLG